MSLAQATVLILVMAASVGAWRTLRSRRRARWLLVALQFAVAAGLYFLLFPPAIPRQRETAIVLTPGADVAAIRQRDPLPRMFALPGVEPTDASIERVPDLATALRRHPRIGSLRVIGDGLPERDRKAVGDLGLAFEPGPMPTGVIELAVPQRVSAGAGWSIRGQVGNVPAARVEVRDRADALSASTIADADGRFRLDLVAKAAGPAVYRLRVLDRNDAVVEEFPLGVVVRGGDPLRVLVVAGAADAEVKYLRRWVVDAGNRLSSRIALSRGIEQLQNAFALDAATLADADLLVIDERAWLALSRSEKIAIAAAVEEGLGLLLRVTGPLPAQVLADWEKLGMPVKAADLDRAVELGGDPLASGALTRWPMTLGGDENASVPLLRAGDGAALGRWRASGQGRVGAWFLLDSYRLVLGGETSRYGTLWSGIFSTLARARGGSEPVLPELARVDQRAVICGVGAQAGIEDGNAGSFALRVDRARRDCAAWWPSRAGWSILRDVESRWPIYVLAEDQAQALLRARMRSATASLARDAAAATTLDAPMPRWPLFLAWLLAAGLLWWLERRSVPVR